MLFSLILDRNTPFAVTRKIGLLCTLVFLSPIIAFSQVSPVVVANSIEQSHEQVAAALVSRCVETFAPKSGNYSVSRPDALMSVDPDVFRQLRSGGQTITLVPWETAAPGEHLIRYKLESAVIDLERSGRRRVGRTVSVSVAYTIINAAGGIESADVCEQQNSDIIPDKLANEWSTSPSALDLRVGSVPKDGLLKRIVRPAVAVAATSVSLYLLFNLRSERQNDSQ